MTSRRKLVLGALLLPALAHAHPGLRPPQQTTPAAGGAPLYAYQGGSARAGYGYLASSEAEAGTAFSFSCEASAIDAYIEQGCKVNLSTLGTAARDSLRIAMRAAATDSLTVNLRRKIAEHETLQKWALSGGVGTAANYSCLRDPKREAPETKLIDNLPNFQINPSRPLSEAATLAIKRGAGNEAADRANVVERQTSDASLTAAIVLSSYYALAAKKYGCNVLLIQASDPTTCRAVNRARFRLRNAYPAIFEPGFNSTELNPEAKAALNNFIPALDTGGSPSSPILAINQLLAGVDPTSIHGPSNLSDALVTALPTPKGAGLRAALNQVRASYKTRLSRNEGSLCSADASNLVVRDPAALRQYLVDAARSPKELALAHLALCQNPTFGITRGIACGEVFSSNTGATETGQPVTFFDSSVMDNYPFSSEARYSLIRSGKSSIVLQNLNLVIPPGTTGPGAAQLASWQNDTAALYNNEAKRLKANVTFALAITSSAATVPSAVNITYHQCWCSTCAADQPPPNSVPPAKDFCDPNNQRTMQADSSNFHSQITLKAIQHEAGHAMGLADEYDESYYPFNSIGEADSLMNNGNRLHRRHFERITHPNRCD